MKYDILVNEKNPIAKDFISNINFVFVKDYLGNDLMIEREAYENFSKFSEYLLRKNIIISPISAYRSYDEQMALYHRPNANNEVESKPGCSDHHTGLAIDITLKVGERYLISHSEFLKEEKAIRKIVRKCRKFGFIIRYPKNKEGITGHDFSPWHLRYVGKKLARELYFKRITLEEYTESKKIAQ